MGEEGVEEWAEHAALRNSGIQDKGRRCAVI